MGLFDLIQGAIQNPNQQASVDQVGSILNTVQQMSGNRGIDPATTQTVLSTVGGYVRSALQQQRETNGAGQAEAIVNQYGGTQPSNAAVQAVFGQNQLQQVVQAVAQQTNINPQLVQAILPMVVPVVLNLLKTGASTHQGAGQPGSNSVLSAFLDADRDGDVDVSDAMRVAGQFLNQPR